MAYAFPAASRHDSVIRHIINRVFRAFQAPGKRNLSALPNLKDHLARDIGLSPAELERQRFRLPSSTLRHPML